MFSTKIKKDGSFQPRLVSPTFTPVRYKASRAASNAKNRHGSETVDGTDYLDFYLLLLTHLARKILSSPDTSKI